MKSAKLSLTSLVVLVIAVSFALLSALFAYNQYLVLKRHAFNEARINMKTILMVSQARFEKEFRHREPASVEREVMALNLLDDVRLSAVVDQAGVVKFSSSFVVLEQPAATQLPQFDQALFQRVVERRNPVLITNSPRDLLIAYYPLVMDASGAGRRPENIGVLYVEWSLSRPYTLIRQAVWQNLAILWGIMAVVLAALLIVLRKIVLRPLQSLTRKADRVASGEETEVFQHKGFHELGELASALNRMNSNLHNSLRKVKSSEQRWVFALEGAGDGVQDWNLLTGRTYFSPQFKKMMGLSQGRDVTWDDWKQLVDPEDWPFVERKIQRHVQGLSDLCRIEYCVQHPVGEPRFILMRGKVVEYDASGKALRFIATHSDITVQRRTEDALRGSEEKYRMLFDMAQEGIWVLDADGFTTLVNDSMAAILGFDKEYIIGRNILEFVEPGTRPRLEEALRGRSPISEMYQDYDFVSRTGRRIHVTMKTAIIYDNRGEYAGRIAGIMDITERKRAEQRIRQQVLYDELTNLPNRRMLNDKLAQEQARALRHSHCGALLFVDLDHFKNVNDSLGHPIGDGLLIAIADRLRQVIREEDTLARLGGDEFVVLLPELSDDTTAAASLARNVALKIQSVLADAFDVSGNKLNIGCSIGIALYPLDQETIHDIMKQADAAMYRAKEEGRNTVRLFSKEMHQQIEQNLKLQMLLPGALEEEQFILYFQPQFNDRSELIGAEVLLRWEEPNLGFVRPDLFIRAAEESGQIIPLGDWVLRKACQQMREWRERGLPDSFERLAINISARQFSQDDFAMKVEAFAREADISPAELELEITESMLLHHLDQVVEKMRLLHNMGFYIALDDFGTGYSSLSYLRELPLHKLKIDQAFVRDIRNDQNDRVIVETIIAMARLMELDVIAEGVEEEYQLNFLKEKGCYQYQGYYFDRPIPADQFYDTWVARGDQSRRRS
ncbi:MAG: EAL domain-containing protein [Pseudomonadota bacterium]|nr:EAL domain-containing protein [Pseudomonadota bacterium]